MKLEGVVTHGIELNTVGCVSNEVVIAFGPIGSYVDMSQFYTMEQTDALLGDKADKVDTYTKDETDARLGTKADKSTTYTKDEVDEMMSNVDTEPTEGSTNFVTSGGVFNALEQKVDKIPGKGLSSHDFTSAYKTKLIGIEEGAEKNIIERIYVNGYLLPVENKNVNIPAATNTMAGVMSASDKRKLNEMLSAVVVKVSDRYGTYEADKTLTDLDIAISQGKDVLYIVNNAYYYRMSFYVPTQCVIAVRMNLNEPLMDNAKASYLYHTITGVTVNSLELASATDLPTDLSDLNNDVGFITSQALANYADGAEYDSTTHYIYLKHGNTRLPNPINAADFIKDGMVETVTVGKPATGPNAGVYCLIVTFNTDAGESPIELPLTQIFDPTNYYTKAEVDTALGGKANSADLASVATSGSYNDLSDKPTIPTVPTNVSAFTNDVGYLTQHQSLADYYTKSEVNSAIVNYTPIIEDTRTSSVVAITGIAPFASLVDKQQILLHSKYMNSGSGAYTLNLTLSDNTTTGAKNIKYVSKTATWSNASGNMIRSGAYIHLIYDQTKDAWLLDVDYDTTYEAIGAAEINTGTATVGRLISAKVLRANFYTKSEINTMIGDIETLLANI